MLVSPSMSSRYREIVKGVKCAILICLVASGTVPLFFASTYAQPAPLFSATLMAVNGEGLELFATLERQSASIIANNMIALGIDAKVEYVDVNEFLTRLQFKNSTLGAPFNGGGYDMLLNDGEEAQVTPDLRNWFVGRPSFLPTVCIIETGCVPNFSLYNSTQLNAVIDQLYASTDTQTKIDLLHKWQEIVFNDSPHVYIFEPVDLVPRNRKWTAWGQKNVYNIATFPDIQHFSGGNNFTLALPYSFTDNSLFTGVPGGTLNPAFSATSATPVTGYIVGMISWGGVTPLDVDSRDVSLYQALATNITAGPGGLDWTVRIRKGVLWQSGVELTSDDFVWGRWAFFTKTASIFWRKDARNLGNVIDFTFLNGTTVTIDNRESANEPVRHGWWKAVDRYSFEFHLSQPYGFTRDVYVGWRCIPLPKHIMEKFAPETWDSQLFSTAVGPYTYTWDVGKYGGSGSYTAVGPVGLGPYYMESYDYKNKIATLKKFHQYWNATGLEALGQFTVETYRVVTIPDKQQAFEALRKGTVDELDAFFGYSLSESDLPSLESMGNVNVIRSPEFAWTEWVFNMRHPVLGTGLDTPLGRSDPSMAAEAARHVRKAISHLIPRDRIINELAGGAGVPLASFLGPGWGIWYNKDLKPDSYDNNTAAAELRAAGYTVGGISTLAPTQQGLSFWVVGGGVIVAVALTTSTLVVVRRRRRRMGFLAARQMIPTGYAELEGLLHGGIPVGYSVLLISPPCDERDLLLRKMLKSNLSSGMQVFHVSGDLGRTQDLVGRFQKDFYAFCPDAHRISSSEQNLFEIPGVGNLVEFNILRNKGLSEHASEGKAKVIVMDLLSDLLFRHKAAMTRKWLAEFIAKRKAQQFTTICTLNPAMASKEETGRITDLFDGIIEIYEKESEGRQKRFLVIRKMYGQDYSEAELLLERNKLL